MAQYHFERAVEIHPANAVLLACLGMVSDHGACYDRNDTMRLTVVSCFLVCYAPVW
jgi:hypothetical protein